jgi:hypothetical protein
LFGWHRGHFGQRENQGEDGAAAGLAGGGDLAALGLGEALDEGQTEAGAARDGVWAALEAVE